MPNDFAKISGVHIAAKHLLDSLFDKIKIGQSDKQIEQFNQINNEFQNQNEAEQYKQSLSYIRSLLSIDGIEQCYEKTDVVLAIKNSVNVAEMAGLTDLYSIGQIDGIEDAIKKMAFSEKLENFAQDKCKNVVQDARSAFNITKNTILMNAVESHIKNCIPDGYCKIGKDAKLDEEQLTKLLNKMSEVELSESLKGSINSGYEKLQLIYDYNLYADKDIFINLDKNNKDSEKVRVIYCSFSPSSGFDKEATCKLMRLSGMS